MDCLLKTTVWLNAVLSDYVLTVLLIGCGVFFSFRTRFIQFRCFGEAMRWAAPEAADGARGSVRSSR